MALWEFCYLYSEIYASMTLIKSISGIRGTIGGQPGKNLTPLDTIKFASAYAQLLKSQFDTGQPAVVLGRDARLSGNMIAHAAKSALTGMGINVIDLGLSTTPSVEMAVKGLKADGGIILTARHNPAQWNALKLLNENGEFISEETGKRLIELVENEDFHFAGIQELGKETKHPGGYIDEHIQAILQLDLVNTEAIRRRGFKVTVDAVNSTGGIAIPKLLEALHVQYECLYCEPNGIFPHNPEPLEKNLHDIMQAVTAYGADLGIVTDPDVDRLALIDEKGHMFGEEYTLVAVADYVLKHTPGPTVSNLSSSRALRDISRQYKQNYYASAVGEVNVVKKMKETGSVIGGEGNGGVIYPALHYGRDALVGIALVLSHLAEENIKLSELKQRFPAYYMAKEKILLKPEDNPNLILQKFKEKYQNYPVNTEDGVKIDFNDSWIHLRQSNTEPIIRIYTEAQSPRKASELAAKTIEELKKMR